MVVKMTLYKNKYRVESIRLKNWDYSNNGYYFVTICTKEKECFLGTIINNKMILSEMGKIINNEWYKSIEIRKNILLDEFIIMPNHIHGIIVINNDNVEKLNNSDINVETHCKIQSQMEKPNGIDINVETHCNASLQKNNLSNIIRGFKSSTTKLIHVSGFENFAWQPRFYEHIIKNEKSLNSIREYIINNPKNWAKDENNNQGISK